MRDVSWNDSFLGIESFISTMLRLPVLSKTADAIERKHASWMARQRMLYRAGKLTADQIAKLNGLPFWHWGKEDAWMMKYNMLVAFIEKHDRMPRNSKSSDDEERALAIWCNTQKQAYNGKGTAKINNTRIVLLEKLSPWRWVDNKDWLNQSWTEDRTASDKVGNNCK